MESYKTTAAGDWAGINRQVLVAGSRGAPMAFDVRYFEIEPNGRSSLEAHEHVHVVMGIRGAGEVRCGRRWFRLQQFDVCYIAPGEVHQLRNPGRAPFGFLCLVDAERDTPRSVAAAELRGPAGPRAKGKNGSLLPRRTRGRRTGTTYAVPSKR